MSHRLASLILMLLTIGFFIYHKSQKDSEPPAFVDTIGPGEFHQNTIAHNEFLILMDEGDEKYLNDVLVQFDLRVISPLGEWVHVAKGEANNVQRSIPLRSLEAKENLELLTKIEDHPAVHSVHLNYIQVGEPMVSCTPAIDVSASRGSKAAEVIPRDPYFRFQWHLSKEPGINLPEAWAITTGSPSTVIGLVDRNFDFSEQDLSPERCPTRQYYYENILDYFPQKILALDDDRTRHGANVLSAVASCTDNGVGLAGIDWHAQVFEVDSKADASYAARMFGMLWAAGIDVCSKSIIGCPENSRFQKNMHPANVINASFGFTGAFLEDPPYGPVLDVIGRINRQGRIIVASVGNEGGLADRRLPGSAGGVISVGSSNEERQSSDFSNYGRTVDVLAPGENILGLKNGQAISLNGTSFSSPIVAGVVSLMLAANPLLAWKHVEYILKETALTMSCEDYCPSSMAKVQQKHCQDYCCDQDKVVCAKGIVDAAKAVKMAAEGLPNVALIDVDDYYLPLCVDNDLSHKVTVKNWGRKKGIAHVRQTDSHLKVIPDTITVDPIDQNGVPGLGEMTIFYDEMPEHAIVASLILEVADSDRPQVFHDRIEAIVEIVPDPPIRKRELRELLPKN